MELSKKEIIVNSWKIMKSHLPLMIAIVLFIITLNIILSIVQEKLLGTATYQSIIFFIAAYLFQMGLNLGLLRICLNMINKIDVDFSLLFSSFHMLIPYALATICYLVALLLAASPGLLLFGATIIDDLDNIYEIAGSAPTILSMIIIIIPVIYLSVRLQFYEYFLIDEECGIIESIKKSADISKGYVLELFILGVALSLMILISIIPMLLAIIFSAPLSMAAGLAGIVFSIPLSLMVISNVYLKLKKNH